jgi:predicted HTH domain antitoxin
MAINRPRLDDTGRKPMKTLEVFSINELAQRSNDLIDHCESGKLALITKPDRPTLLAIPFDQTLIENGVHRSMAINLFGANCLTLAQAARFANLTIYEFLDLLKETDIPVVDYSPAELDEELKAG